MSRPREVCEGMGLDCCTECARLVANVPDGVHEFDRVVEPTLTADRRCLMWQPAAAVTESVEGRL